ncbi:MAG: isoprenylcysteine carboxylmethyltransferase family protein [Pseudomonadota bacterium]
MSLLLGNLKPPPGRARIAVALLYGFVCHSVFAAAVLSMIIVMFFGMTIGLGTLTAPWNWVANAILILQFPLAHSFLLSSRGRRLLSRTAPRAYGGTLSTTTYAIIASFQLIALFILWSPSGVVWWRAEGAMFPVICTLYAIAWLLLVKASYDAGAEVQSGALGWMSMLQKIKPNYPPMPTSGLFAIIRQPIYLSFALTLWTVPVWTPDQLMVAVSLTAYCLIGPLLKERRFVELFGDRFERYKKQTPYMVPRVRQLTGDNSRVRRNSVSD